MNRETLDHILDGSPIPGPLVFRLDENGRAIAEHEGVTYLISQIEDGNWALGIRRERGIMTRCRDNTGVLAYFGQTLTAVAQEFANLYDEDRTVDLRPVLHHAIDVVFRVWK